VLHYTVAFLLALSAPPGQDTAIVGATLIDVSHDGHSAADISNSVVVVSHGRIVAAGDRAHVRIPAHAHVVNADGRFIIPGLIDGYGALRTQGFANAYLYEGVTTVIIPLAPKDGSVDGESTFVGPKNGLSALTTVPISGYSTNGAVPTTSPWAHHRQDDRRLDNASLIAQVRAAAAAGHRAVAVGLDVWPEQLDAIVTEAHKLGLAVTAQVAFTDYPRAVQSGVDAFTRNDKYSLSLSAPRRTSPRTPTIRAARAAGRRRAPCAATRTSMVRSPRSARCSRTRTLH
jgi:hypothetical protein